jgi:hypothetical protein
VVIGLSLALAGLLLGPATARARVEMVLTIPTTLGDTTETFWLQVPSNYHHGTRVPLLVGWHQLGGTHLELKQATQFDSICDARTWILAAPSGPSPTHWNNQAAQSHVSDVIHWIATNYDVDSTRIYMVGASMGGAAGMVYSNGHLDPRAPMVAAAASVSGIQDCERRFHEQGWNYSMAEAFGGPPEQVPFTYHRNSAICFGDSTVSMHVNARHLPLLLSFGNGDSDAIWRLHAEDLYLRMSRFADTVVLHESAIPGHGWGGVEEGYICDFLGAFSLGPPPRRLSISADKDARWYWADLRMRAAADSFGRFEVEAESGDARLDVTMIRNVASLALDLAAVGVVPGGSTFTVDWEIQDLLPADLTLRGVGSRPSAVLLDGVPFLAWGYDEHRAELALHGSTGGVYQLVFALSGVDDPGADPGAVPGGGQGPGPGSEPRPGLRAWATTGGTVRFQLETAGLLSWQLVDGAGRVCRSHPATSTSAGEGTIRWEGSIPGGVYFLRLVRPGRAPVAVKVTIVR